MKKLLKTSNKILRIALSITLCLSVSIGLFPAHAFAEEITKASLQFVNTKFNTSTDTNSFTPQQTKDGVILREPVLEEENTKPQDDAIEISYDENSRFYKTSDGNYTKRMFEDPIMYDAGNGKLKDIQNTLVKRGSAYENKANSYTLKLPKEGEGISIKNKGYTLNLTPKFGDLKNAVVKDNAIRYNNVSDGVDLQYSANGNNVKEDIILNAPIEKTSFSYEIDCKGLELFAENNILYAYEEKTLKELKQYENDLQTGKENFDYLTYQEFQKKYAPIFRVTAPYMTDNANNFSIGVQLKLENNQLIVQADYDWLHSIDRVYPVSIDPIFELDDSNLSFCFVENGTGPTGYGAGPNQTHPGVGYLCCGNVSEDVVGVVAGLNYYLASSFIRINESFTDLPNGMDMPKNAIVTASLEAYTYTRSVPSPTRVYCDFVTEPWEPETCCWNNQPTSVHFENEDAYGNVNLSCADVGGGPKWVTWDISTAVRNWINGSPNYGLALTPEVSDQPGVCFSGPNNPHGGKNMYFDITWTVPHPVDENKALDTPNINLRVLTTSDRSGVQKVTGVFADGEIRPVLAVDYALTGEAITRIEHADYERLYPNSNFFVGQVPFDIGYVGLYRSNWQSKLFKNFRKNFVYNVFAQGFAEYDYNCAVDAGEDPVMQDYLTPTGKSDDFIIYQFSDQDTIPYMANYYGVPLDQVIADNHVIDYLSFPGNTYFVRNPTRNATIPYTVPDNMNNGEKQALIYANLGRGMHSEFDLEPINVNDGNYYFDSVDFTNTEYKGTFDFKRSYNSLGSKAAGVFGRGWSFEYAQRLSGRYDGSIVYTMGDGKQITFIKEGDKYISPDGYYLNLEKFETADEPDKTYYTITKTDGTIHRFNCYGMLETITDRNGFTTTIEYDELYKIKSITTPSGRQYVITANNEGQITKVVLPNGGTFQYKYEDGCLTEWINADGDVVKYEYDANYQMTCWFDGNGNKLVENTFDAQGRVIKQVDANNKTSTLLYTNNSTIVNDGDGNTTTYTYDDKFQTTSIKSSGKSVNATYSGATITSLKEDGVKINYEHDLLGNV
ncbi:MAG: DUF6531 domain-containing protein, partial [Coriobacteriales bacterium]|nr:DUF6531 domain-containing protein [Coriobacteriales bacterium]